MSYVLREVKSGYVPGSNTEVVTRMTKDPCPREFVLYLRYTCTRALALALR